MQISIFVLTTQAVNQYEANIQWVLEILIEPSCQSKSV